MNYLICRLSDMSQRSSGYARRPNEDYATPAWVASIITRYLRRQFITDAWDPAAGEGKLAKALSADGFRALATTDDFLKRAEAPRDVEAIVSNPPYGADRRGALACAVIRHALTLEVRIVAMLLRVDFDSAKTRVALFRDHPAFAGKIVLLDRVKWFDGPSAPSDNHAWFVWDREHRGYPWTTYAGKAEP